MEIQELPEGDRLQVAQELADSLFVHVNFIYAMKQKGFPMPGGLSTPKAALAWLEKNGPVFKKGNAVDPVPGNADDPPVEYNIPNSGGQMTAKELAGELGRSVGYIYAMKRDGFPMPGGLASIKDVLQWLEKHPNPRRRYSNKER